MPFGHRLASPERLDTHTRNEFERLIAAVTPYFERMELDPRDPNTGEILYGQLAFTVPVQILNSFNFPTLAKELGSSVNTFQHEDRVLLRLRPNGADRTINGFQAPAGPDHTPLLIIYNDDDTYALTISHQSTSATDPRDRVVLSGASDLIMSAGDARALWIVYSHTQQRWVQINTSRPASGPSVTTTEAEVTNTVSRTELYSSTLNASDLASGKMVHGVIWGSILKNCGGCGGGTVSLELEFDGTTLTGTANVLTGLGDTASLRPWILKYWISGQGTSAQRAFVELLVLANGLANGTWVTILSHYFAHHNTLTKDSATALAIKMFATLNIAHASFTVTRRGAYLWKW